MTDPNVVNLGEKLVYAPDDASDNDLLVYDASSGYWKEASPGTASSPNAIHDDEDDEFSNPPVSEKSPIDSNDKFLIEDSDDGWSKKWVDFETIESGLDLTEVIGLSDPDADRIIFWDDGADDYDWLSANNHLSISGTNLNVDTGVSNGDIPVIDGTVADNDYAKWTGSGLEGRSYSEVRADLSLDNGIIDLTSGEITQLQNIGSVSITNEQWGYLGDMDQGVETLDSPTFDGLTLNGDLDINSNDILNVKYQTFDLITDGNEPAHQEGLLFYSEESNSLCYYNDNSDVTVSLGREILLKVKNDEGSTINNGDAVYVSGSSGDNPEVKLSQSNNLSTVRGIGIVTVSSIGNGSVGWVCTHGRVHGLDTSSWSVGDQLYIDPSTAGDLTNTKPSQPNFAIRIGWVIRSHASDGVIYVDSDREINNFADTSVIFANSDGELREDTSNFNYNNSTDTLNIQNLNVMSGATIGSYLDMTDGNINDIASIDGGGDAILIDDDLDLHGSAELNNATTFNAAAGVINNEGGSGGQMILRVTGTEAAVPEVAWYGQYYEGQTNPPSAIGEFTGRHFRIVADNDGPSYDQYGMNLIEFRVGAQSSPTHTSIQRLFMDLDQDPDPANDEINIYKTLDMNSSNKIINLSDPTNNQDAATKSYVDSAAGSLNAISDVTITSPANNELLAYDSGTSEWINQTPSEAGFHTVATSGSHDDLTDVSTDDHHTRYALTEDLDSGEITQLQNIGSVTISNTQWGYLGDMDQGVETSASPTFGGLTLNGDLNMSDKSINNIDELSGNSGAAIDVIDNLAMKLGKHINFYGADTSGLVEMYRDSANSQFLIFNSLDDLKLDTNNQINFDIASSTIAHVNRGGLYMGGNLVATRTWVNSNALLQSNNLSDLDDAATARTNLDVDQAGTINYTHPSHPGDDIDIDSGALSGATVISDLDFNVTTDTEGHVTDAVGTLSTRELHHHDVAGLGDDDHTQYLLVDGTRDMTGHLTIEQDGASRIFLTSVDDGSSPSFTTAIFMDGYDSRAQGIFIKDDSSSNELFFGEGYGSNDCFIIGWDTTASGQSEYYSNALFAVHPDRIRLYGQTELRVGENFRLYNSGDTEYGDIYRDDNYLYIDAGSGGELSFSANGTGLGSWTSGSGLTVSGALSVGGDLDLGNNNLDDVASIDGAGDAVVFNDNIDMNDNRIVGVDDIIIESSGNGYLVFNNSGTANDECLILWNESDGTNNFYLGRTTDGGRLRIYNYLVDTMAMEMRTNGDIIWGVPTDQDHFWQVNGSTVMKIDSSQTQLELWDGYSLAIFNSGDTEHAEIYRDDNYLHIDAGSGGELSFGANGTGLGSWTSGSGLTVSGALSVGGDLDIGNNNIDDVASIDGGGNAILFNDDINLNDSVISKAFTSAGHVLDIEAGNNDIDIWRLSANGGFCDSGDWGFNLTYEGTGSGNDNDLVLYSDNLDAASQVEVYRIKQDGTFNHKTNVDMNNNNLDDVASIDGGGNAILFNDDISIRGGDKLNLYNGGNTEHAEIYRDDDYLTFESGTGGQHSFVGDGTNLHINLENPGGSGNSLLFWRDSGGSDDFYLGQKYENDSFKLYNHGASLLSMEVQRDGDIIFDVPTDRDFTIEENDTAMIRYDGPGDLLKLYRGVGLRIFNSGNTEWANIYRDDNTLAIDSGTGGYIDFLIAGTKEAGFESDGDFVLINGNHLIVKDADESNQGDIYHDGTDLVISSSDDLKIDTKVDVNGHDIVDVGDTIWDSANEYIPQTSLQNDSLTVTAGDGLQDGGLVALGGSTALNIDVSDFAGTYLSDDGSENLQVNLGSGLEGDGSNNIRVDEDYDFTFTSQIDFSAGLKTADDIVDGTDIIWDHSAGYIPQGRLENDSLTITAGDGLQNGGSVSLGSSTTLNIDVSDFAGNYLSDDGSENLDVNIGTGLEGDGSNNIRVDEDYDFTFTSKIDFDAGLQVNGGASNGSLTHDGTDFLLSSADALILESTGSNLYLDVGSGNAGYLQVASTTKYYWDADAFAPNSSGTQDLGVDGKYWNDVKAYDYHQAQRHILEGAGYLTVNDTYTTTEEYVFPSDDMAVTIVATITGMSHDGEVIGTELKGTFKKWGGITSQITNLVNGVESGADTFDDEDRNYESNSYGYKTGGNELARFNIDGSGNVEIQVKSNDGSTNTAWSVNLKVQEVYKPVYPA